MALLAAGKEAKLRTFVKPGQMLSIEAHLEHEGSGYAVVVAKIRTERREVCEASITFRVLDFPNAEMKKNMCDFAAGIGLQVGAPADG